MNTSLTPLPGKRAGAGTSWMAIGAVIAALCLLLLSTVTASANTVNVYDNANVLNAGQVKSAASSLPYPMDIYTVNTFNGTTSAFDQQTASHTANNANLIVMAIDTVHRHLTIKAGSRVPLSSGQVQNAVNAFKNGFGNGDYTGASTAAISSLQSSLNSSAGNNGNGGVTPAPAPSGGLFGGLGFSTICCIGLLVLAGLAVFAFIRRRSGGGLFNRQNRNPVMQEPYQNQYNQYNQPYNQGYPPPGYGPGYNQPRQGMNPWAAGGLGAAAGGLAGYELGRMQGEREGQQNDQNQNFGGNDNNAGNFGGGASGDFGGGNDGGGFIGDAGGGGDFGGGGGGGDFGGGGGGNF